MPEAEWMAQSSPAFRLMIATSWLAPDAWRAQQEDAIRKACSAVPDWTEYLRLVDRHRMPAVSWAALKSVAGIDVPDRVQEELRRRSDACRMQAMVHLHLLAGVLKAFNKAAIPVMPLKGPLLSLELYGDAGIRQSGDLDVLVAPEQIHTAWECLQDLHWVDEFDNRTLTRRQREFKLRHNHHLAFAHAGPGCKLELHWRAKWEDDDSAAHPLADSAVSQWQGCSYRTRHPIDLTLYLCNHGANHAWLRAKWLGDMARIFALDYVDWQPALAKARQAGDERSLLLGLRLLKEAYGLDATRLIDADTDSIPPKIMGTVISTLTTSAEPHSRSIPGKIIDLVRSAAYKFWLWPSRSQGNSFSQVAISTADFNLVRMPNHLFWLYIPLRPFLFVLRHLRDFRHERSSTNTHPEVHPELRNEDAVPALRSGRP